MKRIEYENLCRNVAGGGEEAVLNTDKKVAGKVLQCHRDHFNVSVGEGWQVWPRGQCEAIDSEEAKKPSRREPEYFL